MSDREAPSVDERAHAHLVFEGLRDGMDLDAATAYADHAMDTLYGRGVALGIAFEDMKRDLRATAWGRLVDRLATALAAALDRAAIRRR